MAVCSINKNLTRTEFCGYSLKQITTIYLANYEDATVKVALKEDNTYTVETAAGSWYSITPAKDSASYNDDLVVGGNGSKYRTHTVTFSFNGAYSADLAEVLDALSLGKFYVVLGLTDGTAIMLGRTTGLEASAASSLSEAAADGQNGITVTLEANVTEPALVVSEAAFNAIKEAVKQD